LAGEHIGHPPIRIPLAARRGGAEVTGPSAVP